MNMAKQTKNQIMGDNFTDFLSDMAMEDLMERGIAREMVEDWTVPQLEMLSPEKIVSDKKFQKALVGFVREFIAVYVHRKEEESEEDD
jgi:hypothetical protein